MILALLVAMSDAQFRAWALELAAKEQRSLEAWGTSRDSRFALLCRSQDSAIAVERHGARFVLPAQDTCIAEPRADGSPYHFARGRAPTKEALRPEGVPWTAPPWSRLRGRGIWVASIPATSENPARHYFEIAWRRGEWARVHDTWTSSPINGWEIDWDKLTFSTWQYDDRDVVAPVLLVRSPPRLRVKEHARITVCTDAEAPEIDEEHQETAPDFEPHFEPHVGEVVAGALHWLDKGLANDSIAIAGHALVFLHPTDWPLFAQRTLDQDDSIGPAERPFPIFERLSLRAESDCRRLGAVVGLEKGARYPAANLTPVNR
jgi:hypothetical protein